MTQYSFTFVTLYIYIYIYIYIYMVVAYHPHKTHVRAWTFITLLYSTHMTFRWPCIVINSCNKPTFFFLWRCGPTRVMASSFLRFLDHTQRRITVGRTPLDEWSVRRRDLYLTTHNTHNRQISMPPGGIRTHDLSKRAAADLRLRPRGYWNRLIKPTIWTNFSNLFLE